MFLQKKCMSSLCSLEWGGNLFHLHLQMVYRFKTISLLSLHKALRIAVAWDKDAPIYHFVYCKSLKQQGLHIYVGVLGYYLKDSCEFHFHFVESNVKANEKNDGKLEHTEYGVVTLKDCVPLLRTNVIKCTNMGKI